MQNNALLPTIFTGHGGGPMPLLGAESHTELISTWAPGSEIYNACHDDAVKAILVISAHHETGDGSVSVMTDEAPGLLFDYNNFPPETYEYTFCNPGCTRLSRRIMDLLTEAGIPNQPELGRGHDHGTFVPLLGLDIQKRPELPVVSVSLRGPAQYRSRGPDMALTEAHWELGKALAPLRKEGALMLLLVVSKAVHQLILALNLA